MQMPSAVPIAVALLLLVIVGLRPAAAQSHVENVPLREVEVAAGAFSLSTAVPAWVDVVDVPETAQPQPVIIRLADTQYSVASNAAVFVHRAVQVNDAASLSTIGQISIQFVPEYHRVQLHTIRIHRGAEVLDRTASATIRFLQRETGLERGVYSGVVTASILINDVRVGDTLEYSYTLNGQNPVFGDKFVSETIWDQSYLTLLRRVILNYPADRKIAWRQFHGDASKILVPKETDANGTRKLVFEERSLPPPHVEAYAPADYLPFRWLQFSEFATWEDVVAWANALFQLQDEPNDELRAVVAKLRARTNAEERVVAALEFVQSEIRYFSVALGESSHRPTSPNLVLQRRYGDCKDKSLLLITLLKQLGISSHPVLLQHNRRHGLERTLPGPGFFDHVIVRVDLDGKSFYLDPTRLGQHGRLESMGQLHEGIQVLVVDSDSRGIAKLISPNAAVLSRSNLVETATLPKFGADGQIQIRRSLYGVPAENFRVVLERVPHEQLVKVLADAMERQYPGAKLVGDPDIEDDRTNNVVIITTTYTVPKLATETDGNWLVRFTPDNTKVLVVPPSATRDTPLGLRSYPYDAHFTFEITLPEEVSAMADPAVVSVEDPYFAYSATSSFRGNVAKKDMHLTTLADWIEPKDVPKYSEDLRKAADTVKDFVFVAKSAIKSASLAPSDFGQLLRNRTQDLIDKATETINSGKLTGSDLAEAYGTRAAAFDDLGKTEEALRDVNAALKIAPNSPKLLACRAEIYFGIGEFENSVGDYSRAITLGATGSQAFSQRGKSRYYTGRLEEAAEDFLKASEAADQFAQPYNDLWLALTYQRLGRPLPDAVAQRAATEPRGDWPRPALAMLTGRLSPDEMLKLLDEKSGDDRQMALAEAYFYLGQHYLSTGDVAKAREFFEKTRAQNVITYTEHRAARFELQRLAAH
jgi:lipoprotein NlpI